MTADSPGPGSRRSRLARGDRIGPYVVLESIGTGGMGEVYRARDSRLERDVAIKRLLTADVGSEEARARVLREARAAAGLTHPNIAAVFDVLETPDGLVIVMEYVPGESVAMRLSRGPVPVEETLRVGLQIADALAEAQRADRQQQLRSGDGRWRHFPVSAGRSGPPNGNRGRRI